MARLRKVEWPKFVEIGGYRIAIRFANLEEAYGQYTHEAKVIELQSDMPFEDTFNTLQHEMMEAALYISGLAFATKYDQEPIVRCMENLFLPAQRQLFRHLGLFPAKTDRA
jgi:hypothetical protein